MDLEEANLLYLKKGGDKDLNESRWVDVLFPCVGFREDPLDDSFDLKSKDDIVQKKNNVSFSEKLITSFDLVKSFYGFETNTFGLLQVGKSTQQEQRFNLYFKNNRGGKNYRRLTRILFCLGIFGQDRDFCAWKIALFTYLFSAGKTTDVPPGEGNKEYPFLNLWRMAKVFQDDKDLDELVYKQEDLIEISNRFSSIRDFVFQVKDNKGKTFDVKLGDRESFFTVLRRVNPYDKAINLYAVSKENKVENLSSLSWHIVFEPKNWNSNQNVFFLILLPNFRIETKQDNSIDLKIYLTQDLSLMLSIEGNSNPIFIQKGLVNIPKKTKPVVVPKIKVPEKFVDRNPVPPQTTSTKQIVSLLVPLY